jgi:hypothetical protein
MAYDGENAGPEVAEMRVDLFHLSRNTRAALQAWPKGPRSSVPITRR